MKQIFFIASFGFFIVACQKDDDNNNNNNNNTTTGVIHSCGVKDVHNPNLTYGIVKDIDGNSYKTIKIGTQTWMAENLKTTKYRNGTSIPNITDNTQWKNNTTGAFCSYNNNVANDCPYGKLYNWYAVNNTNELCPTGWHVPSELEWRILIKFLDSNAVDNNINSNIAGGKLKSIGNFYWVAPNQDATNSAGFSGLPGGNLSISRGFGNNGFSGLWWSATARTAGSAYSPYLNYFFGYLYIHSPDKGDGLSVRCIKD